MPLITIGKSKGIFAHGSRLISQTNLYHVVVSCRAIVSTFWMNTAAIEGVVGIDCIDDEAAKNA
jgi:hypothetical protein